MTHDNNPKIAQKYSRIANNFLETASSIDEFFKFSVNQQYRENVKNKKKPQGAQTGQKGMQNMQTMRWRGTGDGRLNYCIIHNIIWEAFR